MICVFSCRMHALLCDCSPLNAFFPLLESKHEEGERKRAREREKESLPPPSPPPVSALREKNRHQVSPVPISPHQNKLHTCCVSRSCARE